MQSISIKDLNFDLENLNKKNNIATLKVTHTTGGVTHTYSVLYGISPQMNSINDIFADNGFKERVTFLMSAHRAAANIVGEKVENVTITQRSGEMPSVTWGKNTYSLKDLSKLKTIPGVDRQKALSQNELTVQQNIIKKLFHKYITYTQGQFSAGTMKLIPQDSTSTQNNQLPEHTHPTSTKKSPVIIQTPDVTEEEDHDKSIETPPKKTRGDVNKIPEDEKDNSSSSNEDSDSFKGVKNNNENLQGESLNESIQNEDDIPPHKKANEKEHTTNEDDLPQSEDLIITNKKTPPKKVKEKFKKKY